MLGLAIGLRHRQAVFSQLIDGVLQLLVVVGARSTSILAPLASSSQDVVLLHLRHHISHIGRRRADSRQLVLEADPRVFSLLFSLLFFFLFF